MRRSRAARLVARLRISSGVWGANQHASLVAHLVCDYRSNLRFLPIQGEKCRFCKFWRNRPFGIESCLFRRFGGVDNSALEEVCSLVQLNGRSTCGVQTAIAGQIHGVS